MSVSEPKTYPLTQGDMCKYCGSNQTKVADSRVDEERGVRWRKRKCLNCGKKWVTVEVYEVELNRILRRIESEGIV